MSVFITGTDTNVGKTVVSAWLALHTGYDYWKPIQTGSDSDSAFVQKVAQVTVHKEAYTFKAPLAPYYAAQHEGASLDPQSIVLQGASPCIVEGAGGVFVPITHNFFMIDLIKQLALPVIVVARTSLGTINHTCLTLSALRSRGISIQGVILNGETNDLNKRAIEQFGNVPVLAEIPLLPTVDYNTLSSISFKKVSLD